MSNQTIKGLTVEIGGDTTKLGKALDSIEKQSRSLSGELGSINKLLKMDPGNTELLAQKQKVLADQISNTSEKLKLLKEAEAQVQAQFERGEVSEAQVRALQREIIATENKMSLYEKAAEETADQIANLGKESESTEKDTGSLDQSMKELDDSTEKTGKSFSAASVAVGTFIGNLALDVLKEAVGLLKDMTKAAVDAVAETAEYGDNIDKMSQKLGMSAESYQEWDFIMQHSGSDIDKMSTSMKKLAEAAVDPTAATTAAFKKLGISIEDAANMSQEDLFAATITALQGMESSSERTALANDLLGKSAMDLGALLNTSAKDTEAMRRQVHDLGGVMSNESVRAAAAYQDSLQNLKTAASGTVRGLTAELLPAAGTMMDGLTAVLSGDDAGVEQFISGIEEIAATVPVLISRVTEQFDRIIPAIATALSPETVGQIIQTFTDSLFAMLPTLIPFAASTLITISDTLLSNLPLLVDAALQIILSLSTGISDSLPELIPTVVSVALQIVETLIDNADLLVDAAVALTIGLAEGLISAIPILLEKAPIIVEKLVAALVTNAPKLLLAALELILKLAGGLVDNLGKIGESAKEIVDKLKEGLKNGTEKIRDVGKDLIRGLWNGISDMASWIHDKIKGFGEGVLNKLKGFFGISSPSKKMRDVIGRNLPPGIADGVDDEADTAIASVERLADKMSGVRFHLGVDTEFPDDIADFQNADFDTVTLQRSIQTQFAATPTQLFDDSGLFGRLDAILTAIEHGQVLMLDGAALVGGTANRMDRQLGTIRALAERGAV